MSAAAIDFSKLYSNGLPDPAPRWAPFPQYYFVGGNNDPEQIPIEGLIEAAASVLRREGAKLAIYNLGLGPQGYPGLRQFVADKAKRHRGIDVPIDDVTIMTGSGQGIDMISKLLVNPGDTVLVEEFCYQGAINRFRKLGANVVGMKLDADGIVIDALADQLAGLKAQGITPKFIYTIPTIQNPTASILPLDRRHALLKLARQYNVADLRGRVLRRPAVAGHRGAAGAVRAGSRRGDPPRLLLQVARPGAAARLPASRRGRSCGGCCR